jgi:putative ATP-binding cassette transporter
MTTTNSTNNSDPQINENRFHPHLWRRFWSLTKPYWRSEQKFAAWGLLIVVLLLAGAVVGLNLYLTFVGNYITTALQLRDIHGFYHWLYINAIVFVIGTPIVVYAQWTQQKLSINWRKWLTDRLLRIYFSNRAYYTVNLYSNVDNPDQRLTDDVSNFTNSTMSYAANIFASVLTIALFITALYHISHFLTWILIAYAVVGTAVSFLFGRKLIFLSFNQQRQEANFRYGMVRVRENTESIAFYHGEAPETMTARSLLMGAVRNYNFLIGWQRNLNFFTTSYNYFVVIVPYLVVAPLYFMHKVEMGAIIQAGSLFSQILGAASLIVSNFADITNTVATIDRLSNFNEAIQNPVPVERGEQIRTQDSSRLSLDSVTLETPDRSRVLIRDVSAVVEQGEGLLIVGPSGSGKSSLLRAMAGLWDSGSGTIERPRSAEILFLPQKPYMVLGSLRHQLAYPRQDTGADDASLLGLLGQVGLGDLAERVGGLDAEQKWDTVLSQGEQQKVAFARLLLAQPDHAVLDEATSALDGPSEEHLYQSLRAVCPFYVSVGHNPSLRRHHRHILELDGTGGWQLSESAEYIAQ